MSKSYSRDDDREDKKTKETSRWDDTAIKKEYQEDRDSRSSSRKRSRDHDDWEEDRSRDKRKKRKDDEGKYEWGTAEERKASEPKPNKAKPDFRPSGLLHKELLTTESGAVLKYVEPPEARVPVHKWRLYPFKEDQSLEPYKIYHRSCYLIGRDRSVVHIPTDHQTCSKQHAAIQFREVSVTDPNTGETKRVVKPYIIDLGSTNGTYLNGERIEDSRYIELKNKDCLKFGYSTREYVIINESLAMAKK